MTRGTIVTPLPNESGSTDNEGVWMPIYPPEGEVRYIRADAIQAPAAAARADGRRRTPAANPTGNLAQDAEALYKQGHRGGEVEPAGSHRAIQPGRQQRRQPRPGESGLNRANWLRDNLRNPTPTIVPGPTPGADLHVRPPRARARSIRWPPTRPVGGAGGAARRRRPSGDQPRRRAAVRGVARRAPGTANEYSTPAGWLQASGRAVEGRKTYVMVSDRGVPFYYVTAQPGVNLEPYLKHRVECYGEAIYSGELRRNYMRMSRVEMREGQ